MRTIYPIIILLLLAGTGASQLAPDKERFDIVLHPGDVEERTLKLTNVGDSAIYEISGSSVSGSAKDFIFLSVPEAEPLKPGDEAKIKVFFAIPPETKPGPYAGFMYLLDSTPPSMPVRIEFNILVVGKESYGLSMTIEDSRSAMIHAKADDIAQFDLAVKNLGIFRDVASIDSSPQPDGWTVTLLDGEKEVSMPFNVSLDPNVTHHMKIQIRTSEPGRKGDIVITATSLGNRSQNSSVNASVDFAMAVRGYNVDIEVPDQIVANKTYKGSFNVMLEVKEKLLVGIVTPPQLMAIPAAQVIDVSPEKPGSANFTMLASEPGTYPIVFQLIDSHGIPMPEELTTVSVVQPEGIAVLTADDFLYSTVASLCTPDNQSVGVLTAPAGRLSDKDREWLQGYSTVVILGNQSTVGSDAERALSGMNVKRISGQNLNEECWLFTSEMWQNGTSEVVLSSSQPADVFRAYQAAKIGRLPLIISEGNVTTAARTAIVDMTKRKVPLAKAFVAGDIGEESARALQEAGVLQEKVAA